MNVAKFERDRRPIINLKLIHLSYKLTVVINMI